MLYIIYTNLFGENYFGIKKKIFAQMKILNQCTNKILYTSYSGQMLYLFYDNKILEKEVAITKQECHEKIINWLEKYNISKTYIRYDYSDKWFIDFLKKQKEMKIRTVLEFPTYPYDGEITSKRVLIEDGYYRERLHDYIEVATTYARCKKIFEINVIPLVNGVDINNQFLNMKEAKADELVMIGVASMCRWHGYERVIEGLKIYYQKENVKKKVYFKLVGTGIELKQYKRQVKEYQLEEYVEFCGLLKGEALERKFEEADIAIGSLGMYKIGLKQGSPIKLIEYCARGIPIVYGYDDLSFHGDEYYGLKIPNDNSPVDIFEVTSFYNKVISHSNFKLDMREYVEKSYTWQSILQPVIEYYNN